MERKNEIANQLCDRLRACVRAFVCQQINLIFCLNTIFCVFVSYLFNSCIVFYLPLAIQLPPLYRCIFIMLENRMTNHKMKCHNFARHKMNWVSKMIWNNFEWGAFTYTHITQTDTLRVRTNKLNLVDNVGLHWHCLNVAKLFQSFSLSLSLWLFYLNLRWNERQHRKDIKQLHWYCVWVCKGCVVLVCNGTVRQLLPSPHRQRRSYLYY